MLLHKNPVMAIPNICISIYIHISVLISFFVFISVLIPIPMPAPMQVPITVPIYPHPSIHSPIHQWFSNLSVHQNPIGGLLKHRFLYPCNSTFISLSMFYRTYGFPTYFTFQYHQLLIQTTVLYTILSRYYGAFEFSPFNLIVKLVR